MTSSFSKTYTLGGDFKEFEPNSILGLSIELSLDGFSFMVREGRSLLTLEKYVYQGVNGYGEFAEALKELLEIRGFSNSKFQKVNVSFHAGSLVFVPKEVFDQSLIEKYYGFCELTNNPTQIVYDNLEVINCVCIYEIPEAIQRALNSFFPDYEISNTATTIIRWYLKNQRNDLDGQRVVIHLRRSGLDIFWFEKNKLLFYNSFICKELGDFVYFLMFFLEQFNIDASSINAIIFGETIETAEFTDHVNSIFNSIERIKPAMSSTFPNLLPDQDYYRFHLLLNIKQCE